MKEDFLSCEGKIAVVSGAAGRLGPVWVSALLGAGARVVALAQNETLNAPEVQLLRDAGAEVMPVDVNSETSLATVQKGLLGEYGRVDILVINAGVDHRPEATDAPLRLDNLSAADIDPLLTTNVRGALQTLSLIGGLMLKTRKGSIVLIGSQYATLAPKPSLYSHLPPLGEFVKNPAYGASKAAVLQLVRQFAAQWGAYGVRVNALSPGGVAGGQDPQFRAKFQAEVPLGRMAEPADLVGPLLFLASDASSFVSGHNLVVDGAYSAW